MAAKKKPAGKRPAAPRPAPRRSAAAQRPSTARTTPGGRPLVPPNKVAVASAPMLARIALLPRALLPVLMAVGVFAGLAAGGAAGLVCMLAVAGVLAWLLAIFWPVTPTPGRVLRVVAIGLVVLVGVLQVV